MKSALLITLLLGITIINYSQEPVFDWANNFGGTDDETSVSIALDDQGNIYTTGSFSGTTDFDPGIDTVEITSNGETDIFVAKSDSLGNYIWAVGFGGTLEDEGNAIAVDASGNVYVTGFYQENVDFEPGSGTTNLNNSGDYDVFVVKLDPNGDLIWAKNLSGGDEEIGRGITVDNAGNVYTVGQFNGTTDFKPGGGSENLTSDGNADIFVSKLNASGSFVWAKRMGGNGNDICYSIALDNSDDILTTGYFMGTADFDPGGGTVDLTSAGSFDIFISKLDNSGNFLWAKNLGGSSVDFGRDIAIDGLNNAYAIGYFQGTADFNPDSVADNLLTSNGGSDIFIAKFDASGAHQWAKSIGGGSNDLGLAIDADLAGNVYTTGYFFSTVDFDPGAGSHFLSSFGNNDVFVSKIDALGNHIWAKNMGGTGNDYGKGIVTDLNENVFTTGNFQGTADFEPGTEITNLTSAGSFDAFTVKLGPCQKTVGNISVSACLSYTSPSGNYTWTTSNIYMDTIANFSGCDSIVTIDLTITTSTSSNIADTACVNYISPSGNYIWTSSNTYMDTIANSAGCDSIITVDLIIDTVNTAVTSAGNTLTAAVSGADYQWINCDSSFTAISGETNQSYTATINGNYAVIVTENGCSDTSACFPITSVSTSEIGFIQDLAVFPNPTNGLFTVSLGAKDDQLSVKIVNLYGQTISSQSYQNVAQINLEILGAAGYYMVHIVGNNTKSTNVMILKN
ncbi:MAG: T9SS type A sorting domain-containing protein [Crocinitomicaceae bacterium]|nr:T9SS type A sorting domain-containing protein [Crocinitomicaceae bacterium]